MTEFNGRRYFRSVEEYLAYVRGELPDDERAGHDERLAEMVEESRQLWLKHRPKLGRWVWCKYCGRHVRPAVGRDYSIVVCTRCDYGLAPMKEVCEAGSYWAWYVGIHQAFHRENSRDGGE